MSKVGSIDTSGIPECSTYDGSNRTTPIEMKVFSSDINFTNWSRVTRTPARARAKSYSSFSRLTSFMAGSPRTAVKYYCSNPRKPKVSQRTSKTRFEPATKTSLLLKQRKNATSEDGGRNTTEATVEAARLALAARAEYSKRRNPKSLEKAAFYIVMNDKTKHDLVGRKASPSQLEDIGSLLLEEAQRCEKLQNGEDLKSVGDRHRLTPIALQSLQSGSRSQSRSSKSRKKDPSRHTRHHRRPRHSTDSKSSEGVVSATASSPSSAACDSIVDEIGESNHVLQIMTTTMTTTASDNEDVFEAGSTVLTTASTPEDFLSNDNSLSLLTPGEQQQQQRCVQTLTEDPLESRCEDKSRRESQSSSSSFYERQKEALLRLNGISSGKLKSSSINRLSSTVSSVFDRQGSSAVLNPFPPDNPITTTSANSKPVSPISLVIAGLVMLTGTCAFLVSFALGRQGTWTLAASIVMGIGAVLVFSGLCWYLAHTSAPSGNSKTLMFGRGEGRPTSLSDVEIKVVDRQQLDKIIKHGACVKTVNTVSLA